MTGTYLGFWVFCVNPSGSSVSSSCSHSGCLETTDWIWAARTHLPQEAAASLHGDAHHAGTSCTIACLSGALSCSSQGGVWLAQEAGPKLLVKLWALHRLCLTVNILLRNCPPQHHLVGLVLLWSSALIQTGGPPAPRVVRTRRIRPISVVSSDGPSGDERESLWVR